MDFDHIALHSYPNSRNKLTIEEVVNKYHKVPKDKVLYIVRYWAHETEYEDDKPIDVFNAYTSETFETRAEAEAAFDIRKVSPDVGFKRSGLKTYSVPH